METIESLEKVENNYKEKIDILEIQVEDAYRMIERYILENERLGERDASRASMTRLQIAVSLLIFVYGWLYGSYFKCN